MRIFTAIPMAPAVGKYLSVLQQLVVEANPEAEINWVPEGDFHVTINFLGEQDASSIERLKSLISGVVTKMPAFTAALGELDAFPDLEEPRVVLARIQDELYKARELEALLNYQLTSAGFYLQTRPWQPHITMGRVKACTDQVPLVFPTEAITPLSWEVDRVVLFKSELTSRGAEYSVVETFLLT